MSQALEGAQAGVAWQRGIWDRYRAIYEREGDQRFVPVVEQVLRRATLVPGQHVLDLGTGTEALRPAALGAPSGDVVAVDLSPAMLAVAQHRAEALGVGHMHCREGRAEALPVAEGACDVVLASLSLMSALDRAAAAREIARVLRPGGRGSRRCGRGQTRVMSCALSKQPGALPPRHPCRVWGPAPWPTPVHGSAHWPRQGLPPMLKRRRWASTLPASLRRGT